MRDGVSASQHLDATPYTGAMDSMSPCDICGTPTRMRCQRCNTRAYCGAECQRSDWKSGHRRVCTPAPSKAGSVARKLKQSHTNSNSEDEAIVALRQKAKAYMQSKERAYRGYFGDYVEMTRRLKFKRGVRMIPNIDLGRADDDTAHWTWTEASNGCFCPRLCDAAEGVTGTSFEVLAKPGVWDEALLNEHHGRMLELAQIICSGALRKSYADGVAAQAGPGVLDSICEFGYGVLPIRFMDSSRAKVTFPDMDLNDAHGMLVASMESPWICQVTHIERTEHQGVLDDGFWDVCWTSFVGTPPTSCGPPQPKHHNARFPSRT